MDLSKYEPKGQLKGFPKEIIAKMLEYQFDQTGFQDVRIFESDSSSGKISGGFDWKETIEGGSFWTEVIDDHKFSIFSLQSEPEEELKYGDRVEYKDGELDDWGSCGDVFVAKLPGESPYLIADSMEDLTDTESPIRMYRWKYCRKVNQSESFVQLTLQDISDGKGVGIDPNKIKIIESH